MPDFSFIGIKYNKIHLGLVSIRPLCRDAPLLSSISVWKISVREVAANWLSENRAAKIQCSSFCPISGHFMGTLVRRIFRRTHIIEYVIAQYIYIYISPKSLKSPFLLVNQWPSENTLRWLMPWLADLNGSWQSPWVAMNYEKNVVHPLLLSNMKYNCWIIIHCRMWQIVEQHFIMFKCCCLTINWWS